MESIVGSVGFLPYLSCLQGRWWETSQACLSVWERVVGACTSFSCHAGERPLTKCLLSSRLGTRTKESKLCASTRSVTSQCVINVKIGLALLRWEAQAAPSTDLDLSGEGFECEHTFWDPKDGELCLSRPKSGETLVEGRSGSNVQIDRRTWV